MNADGVTVAITYRAKQEMVEAAREELSRLVATVVAEERDCLGITVHQEIADPTKFVLYEQWTSQEAYMGEHMRTPHILDFIERAGQYFTGPPQIEFWRTVADERPAAIRAGATVR